MGRQTETDNPTSDDIQQSGMWSLSPTNNFIANRMVGHLHGFFQTTSAFGNAKGEALNKVCTRYAPLGTYRANVNHGNERFGFYLDSQWPRNLNRSIESNGYVVDMEDYLH